MKKLLSRAPIIAVDLSKEIFYSSTIHERIARNFRFTKINNFHIFGSSQPTDIDIKYAVKNLNKKQFHVIDLREETH